MKIPQRLVGHTSKQSTPYGHIPRRRPLTPKILYIQRHILLKPPEYTKQMLIVVVKGRRDLVSNDVVSKVMYLFNMLTRNIHATDLQVYSLCIVRMCIAIIGRVKRHYCRVRDVLCVGQVVV